MYNQSTQSRVLPLGLLAASVLLFSIHASAYAAWLIDDAGISIAYATNLAHGHGLVSQPGAPPVEGYSDALWVFLLALLARAGALSVPGTLKVMGGVLVAGTYLTLLATARRVATRPLLVASFVLVFCSANPSFVIWCMSGLENPLYTFTIVLLEYLTLWAVEKNWPERALVFAGFVAALVAMTRPDGALFAALPPLALVARSARWRRPLLAYLLSFGAPMAVHLAARAILFHHLLPNTYVAKGGIHLTDLVDLPKLGRLLAGAFPGSLAGIVLAAGCLAAAFLARRGRFDERLSIVSGFALFALADYMILPRDRMDENRFGTPFYPLYYTTIFTLLDRTLEESTARRKPLAFTALAASALLACAPDFAGRALFFARAPSIGLFYVRRAFAERFDRYADTLRVTGGSIVLSDVGGMLLWSRLRVVDLAGLCDETLARTLSRDPPATRQYILGAVRPTFIHVADVWAKDAALEEDPRFVADYTAIHAYGIAEDPPSAGHAAGLFVRRDALPSPEGETALDPLRNESHFRLGFLPQPADSLFLRWLDETPLVPADYRARLSAILREKSGVSPAAPAP